MSVRLTEVIDRIFITLPLHDSAYFFALERLQVLSKMHAAKWKPFNNGTGVLVTPRLSDGSAVRLTLNNLYGYSYLRYDFEPAGMSRDAALQLASMTDVLGPLSYRHALTRGCVSYLEIAIDFIGKAASEVLIHSPYARDSHHILNSKDGSETHYTGAPSARQRGAAYDRALRLKAHKKPCMFSQMLRIERKVRRTGLSPIQLPYMENCFLSLHVIDQVKANMLTPTTVPAGEWKSFLIEARASGVAAALANYPAHRKTLWRCLRDCGANWWKPENYMTKWPQTARRQLHLDLGACGGA